MSRVYGWMANSISEESRLIQTGGELDEGMTDEDLLADDDTKMELDDDTAPSAGESSRRGGEDGGRA